jgi:hypothetical protein
LKWRRSADSVRKRIENGRCRQRVCHAEDIKGVKHFGLSSHFSAKFQEKRVKTMNFTRLFNVFKRLRDLGTAKGEHTLSITTVEHKTAVRKSPAQSAVTANATARTPIKFSKEFLQNHQPLDFNLTEALRLRAEGWSNRKIARKMNNVSRETVRVRLREYDAAQVKAVTTKPIPAAPKPAPPAVTQSVPAPSPVTPVATRAIVTPSAPSPITNFDELAARWKARYGGKFPLDLTHFFIVRSPHVQFGLGSEQPVIGIDRWHSEYRTLGMFQPPTKFWVLVNAEDGSQINRAWLSSIAADVWLRERCMVARITHGLLSVFQSRYSAHRQYPPQAFGKALADDTFERQFKFEPMPLHSHHELLVALAKDAVPPEVPQIMSSYSTGWTATAPLPPQAGWIDDSTSRRQEAAGGLAGQDDGTNYGK